MMTNIRIQLNRIESYEFEETEEPDTYQRGDIRLVFDGIHCIEVWVLDAQFKKLNSYRDLEKLIEMYEG